MTNTAKASFKTFLLTASCAATLCAFSVSETNAAGFYIQEQSVSGLGTAFAGSVTSIEDASTIYFNPAGMTKLDGIHTQAAAHVLIPNAKLTDTGSTAPPSAGGGPIGGNSGGNPYDPSPVPNLFASYQINDQWWAGIGVTAPFGLANEYKDGWFGRYDSLNTELLTLDVAPSVAFKVNDKLSLGAGLNIQYADAELTSAANAGTEGVSKLEGDDISVGYNLGIQYKPVETITIGANYRSAISHELDGRISATGTGADFNVSGGADLDLPDIATFGVAHDVTNKWTIMGQATWFGWNNFQDITAVDDAGVERQNIIQNYQTTWAFAVGTEYDYSDDLTLRAGVQYDETPTTDQYRTSRTPDGDRTWLSTGGTYALNEKIDIDFAATYIWISEEEINVTRNAPNTATVRADTEGSVGILAVGLNYKF